MKRSTIQTASLPLLSAGMLVRSTSAAAGRQELRGRVTKERGRRRIAGLQLPPLLLLAFIACLAALLVSTAHAASPQVKVSRFANLPARLTYLDDSSIVLYFDSIKGEVYRSEDEGKSWKLVDGPTKGSAYLLVEHPYDRRMVRHR